MAACALCGRPGLPGFRIRCEGCQRAHRATCATCGAEYVTARPTQRYCTPSCRPNRGPGRHTLSATARGLGVQWQRVRLVVLERDGHRCAYCGCPADTVDHIVPRARGGTHDPHNLISACRSCNSRKGAS